MKFTIIITSQSRPKELERFFQSINNQKDFDLSSLQIIFVDQCDNKSYFDILVNAIDKVYIKYHKCGLSEARNQALKYVKGDYIAFGDDDSWYDSDTLAQIQDCIGVKQLDGIGTCICNENNVPYSSYPDEVKPITFTQHYGISSASMFLRFDSMIRFDENIGVGSKCGLPSGEETDYLWQYMEKHKDFKMEFHPEIIVRHPVMQQQNFDNYLDKCYQYAKGFGYIMRKHKLPLFYKIKMFVRPLGGMVIYAFINSYKMKKSFNILKGRIEGYLVKN